MQVDLMDIIDWIARISLVASAVRLGLHWLKGGLEIWVKDPTSKFWGFYSNVEATLGWLAVSLQKFGKKEQVAGEAIKDLLENQPRREFDVTVKPKEELEK